MKTTKTTKETHVPKFDREIGLDQESAASWRKRWEAELLDEKERLSRTEATCQWFDERDANFFEEQLDETVNPMDEDRGDLRDDGRSGGYGESYAERNH